MRRAILLLAATGLLASTAAPAQAILFVGTCALKVTFRFETPVGLDSAPDYSVTVAPLDPSVKPCVTTEHFRSVGRTTGVTANNGESTFWTCDSVLGSGGWFQWWRDSDGLLSPPSVNASHRITGTWGAWTMEMESANPVNFLGVMELTLDQAFAQQATAQCANGTLKTLRTVGVQVFQDPLAILFQSFGGFVRYGQGCGIEVGADAVEQLV